MRGGEARKLTSLPNGVSNPRGSSGYGRQFQRAVEKEWGGKTYTDIMDGVNAVLEKHT